MKNIFLRVLRRIFSYRFLEKKKLGLERGRARVKSGKRTFDNRQFRRVLVSIWMWIAIVTKLSRRLSAENNISAAYKYRECRIK